MQVPGLESRVASLKAAQAQDIVLLRNVNDLFRLALL